MQNLQAILAAVRDETLRVRPGAATHASLWIIDFLSGTVSPARADAAYLLSEAELPSLAVCGALPPAAYFVACAGDTAPDIPPEIPDDATVVFVRSTLPALYSRLNRALDVLRIRGRIDDIVLIAENANYNPEQLVETLAQLLGLGVFILNSAYQRISGVANGFGDDPCVSELLQTGGLSAECVRAIRAGSTDTPCALFEAESGKWSRFNVLLLWHAGARLDPQYLCERLSDFVIAYRRRNLPPDIPPFLIDRRLNRILEGKTTDEAEIRSFFGVGGAPVWFAVLTLGSDPGVRWSAEAYQRQAQLLYSAFRNISVTVVDARVCAVVQLPIRLPQDAVFSRSFFAERGYNEGWDTQRMERELRQLGVYLCCSSIFQTLRFFPAEYSLISDALDIAIKLESCRGRRIVDFHDYSPYVAIKYAVERYLQTHGERSIRAVLYPEMVTLLLHDIHNGTDYVEVLYRYYIYGDVNRTAQSLFVHRNTVYNKLKAIQKLLNVDVDDAAVRGSYLTSLRLYYYCEKCLGLDLRTVD